MQVLLSGCLRARNSEPVEDLCYVLVCASLVNNYPTSCRVCAKCRIRTTIIVDIDTINVCERISTVPAAEGGVVASDAVGLGAVFGVPFGSSKAPRVDCVFGRAAVLGAEGLVGVGVLHRFVDCRCEIPG